MSFLYNPLVMSKIQVSDTGQLRNPPGDHLGMPAPHRAGGTLIHAEGHMRSPRHAADPAFGCQSLVICTFVPEAQHPDPGAARHDQGVTTSNRLGAAHAQP